MGLANCKECGVLFLKTKSDLCDKCIQAEQELIQNINEFCAAKSEVTLEELVVQFRVPQNKLEKFLIERKLVQIMDKLVLKCKSCGVEFTLTNQGRLHCKKCSEKMEQGLGSKSYETISDNSFNVGKNNQSKYSFKSNRNF